MNEQLNKYILDARASGLSEADIYEALLVTGWNKESVETAMKEQVVTTTQQAGDGKGGRKRRWVRIFFIVLSLLILLLVVMWFFPFPRAKTPTLERDMVSKYTILRSVTNADLGIQITQQTGDITEDFVRLAGVPMRLDAPSTFWEKHRGQTEETAILDEEDKQNLMKLVSNGAIQLKLPSSVLEISGMVLPSLNTIRQISRIISRTAQDLASRGKYEEAEDWLHLTIMLGRNLEDGSTYSVIWHSGIALEKKGSAALQEVLLKQGKTEQAAIAARNLQDLEKQRAVSSARSVVRVHLIQTTAMFYQITLGRIPAGALPVRAIYALQGISREQFLSELAALIDIHDERSFTNDILPLTMLAQMPIEPERTLAKEIINAYTKSSRADIRKVAESAMAIRPNQINQLLK